VPPYACHLLLPVTQLKLSIHPGPGSTTPTNYHTHCSIVNTPTTSTSLPLQAWLPKTPTSKRLATLPRGDRSDGSNKHRQSSHKNSPLANPYHTCSNPKYACKDLHPAPSTSAHLALAYNNQNPQPSPKPRAATIVSRLPVCKHPIQHTSKTLRRPRYLTGVDQTRFRPSTRTMPRPAERLPQGI